MNNDRKPMTIEEQRRELAIEQERRQLARAQESKPPRGVACLRGKR